MGYYAPKPERTFTLAPVGLHKAILYGLVDIGTHQNIDPKTKQPKLERQVVLMFELHGRNAPAIDGKPPIYTRRLKFSMHEKANLRKIVEALTGLTYVGNEYGDGIDIEPALGQTCQMQIVESKKANGEEGRQIGSLAPIDPDAPLPVRFNPLVQFSLVGFDAAVFNTLSPYLQKLITESPEFGEVGQVPRPSPDDNNPFDDVPFSDGDGK